MTRKRDERVFVDLYPELADIPEANSWLCFADDEPATQPEQTCRLIDQQERRFVLRVVDRTLYDRTKREFEFLRQIRSRGSYVPDPIRFGFCGQGKRLFLLTGDVAGRSLHAVLAGLSAEWQYALGVDTGLLLKTIHHCPTPCSGTISPVQLNEQARRLGQACHSGRIHPRGCQKLQRIMTDSLNAMQPRAAALLHGRFLPDQLVMAPECGVRIKDLSNWRYGDPFAEVANALISFRAASVPFAIGLLDCYFVFAAGEEILHQLSGYAAMQLLQRCIEASRDDAQENERICRDIDLFCHDYPGEQTNIPSWFKMIRKAVVQYETGV